MNHTIVITTKYISGFVPQAPGVDDAMHWMSIMVQKITVMYNAQKSLLELILLVVYKTTHF